MKFYITGYEYYIILIFNIYRANASFCFIPGWKNQDYREKPYLLWVI